MSIQAACGSKPSPARMQVSSSKLGLTKSAELPHVQETLAALAGAVATSGQAAGSR